MGNKSGKLAPGRHSYNNAPSEALATPKTKHFWDMEPSEIPEKSILYSDVKVGQIITKIEKGFIDIVCQSNLTFHLYYNNPNYARIIKDIEIGKLYTITCIDKYHPKFNFVPTGQDICRNNYYNNGVIDVLPIKPLKISDKTIIHIIPIRIFTNEQIPKEIANHSEVIFSEQIEKFSNYLQIEKFGNYLRIFIENSKKDKIPLNVPCSFYIVYSGISGHYIFCDPVQTGT